MKLIPILTIKYHSEYPNRRDLPFTFLSKVYDSLCKINFYINNKIHTSAEAQEKKRLQ